MGINDLFKVNDTVTLGWFPARLDMVNTDRLKEEKILLITSPVILLLKASDPQPEHRLSDIYCCHWQD